MRSLLIDKINHTNPKSSYPAQGSCSHQQDRRGVCLLEVLQSPGGSALAELLEGVCSVGTRLGNDLECVPLGRVGGGHCCPSQPAWAAGEGQGRTSTPVCEPQGTSPEPLHPPLGLAELLCLSLADPWAVTSSSQCLSACLCMGFGFWAPLSSASLGTEG